MKRKMCFSLLIVVLMLGFWGFGDALASTTNDGGVTATIDLPSPLSVSADTPVFALTFSDFHVNAESDTATVTYTFSGNNISFAPMSDFITVDADSTIDGINLMADPGTFTNNGGPTNLNDSDLPEPAGDAGDGEYKLITTSPKGMKDKGDFVAIGDGKAVIDGTMPITYKAKLTRDHESILTAVTVTVTIKDV